MSSPRQILFVDDERSVLRSLRRVFIHSGYKIYFADTGELGLKILAVDPERFDMVVSDMRMPGMDGYTFLAEVKRLYPRIIRLILSGYVEESYVYKALIEGAAKTYLAKPWEARELLDLVDGLFQVEDTLNDLKLLEVINTIDHLPTLPEIYHQVMEMIGADADFGKIVEILEQDPAITAKVLQVANSAFFKSGTASLKRAAVFIGMMTLKDIVAGSAVFHVLDAPAQGLYSPVVIWEHAVACNALVGEMYEMIHDEKLPEDLASVGLLHNIGLLVLLKFFPEQVKKINDLCSHDQTIDPLACERELLGVDHARIGAYLLDWWNMPYPLVEAALYHHEPLAAAPGNREIVCLLHVADHLVRAREGDFSLPPLAPEILAQVELPERFRQECRLTTN